VTSIGEYAFAYCNNITSITIGSGLASIQNQAFFFYNSGSNIVKLTGIDVDSENASFSSINGVLFNKLQTNLIQYPGGNIATSYTIPNGTISVGRLSFVSCEYLNTVIISNTVTTIGEYAFYIFPKLTSITISNSVTSIGEYGFYFCTGLTSVTIPNSVTSMGAGAFSNCSKLTTVILSTNLKSLSSFAFSSCGLVSITIPKNITSLAAGVFFQCLNLIRVDFLGINAPEITGSGGVFGQTSNNLKIYRKKNLGTGWTSTLQGKPVFIFSDNIIKSGGTGRLIIKKIN
jgi:hypothetical protein